MWRGGRLSSAVSENPMEEVHLPSRQLPRVTHVPRAGHLSDTGAFCDRELGKAPRDQYGRRNQMRVHAAPWINVNSQSPWELGAGVSGQPSLLALPVLPVFRARLTPLALRRNCPESPLAGCSVSSPRLPRQSHQT